MNRAPDTIYNTGIDAARLTCETIPFQVNIWSYSFSQIFQKNYSLDVFVVQGSLNWNLTFWQNYYLGFYTLGYTALESDFNSNTFSLQFMFEKSIANIGREFTPSSGKNAYLNTTEYGLTFDYTLKDIQ